MFTAFYSIAAWILMQAPTKEVTQISFFTFTAQGMLQWATIAGIGYAVLKRLRKIDRNFAVWVWEHEVMWQHHKLHNDIPAFPNLIIERRRVPRTPTQQERQINKGEVNK